MKMFFALIIPVVVIFLSFLLWASYPWSVNHIRGESEVLMIETEEMQDLPEHPSVLKILTFNLGFLYGKGSEGPGYEFRDKGSYEEALKKLSQDLKSWEVDIVCLQEVDFDSSRSHLIDQAEYLARKAGFPYVAKVVSWKANYIPFPYWPIKNHFGRMNSGGAILSKYPLSQHQFELFSKPKSQPWWYNLFYLHRYFQKVTVEVGEKKFNLLNLHLEAFDKNDRKDQISNLVKFISSKHIDFVAGDFNLLPKSATKKSKFENDDDYENDQSYEIMLNSGLKDVIPDEIYKKEESLYFTFPAWAPDRKLDYIWYRSDLKLMKAEVLSTKSSDHLPLRASFQIGAPKFILP